MTCLLEGEELQAAYADFLAGRVQLVGWGCIAPFPYYFLTSPLIPDRMIDVDPGKWGRLFCGLPTAGPESLAELSAADTVIMIYPIYAPDVVAQILSQISRMGAYRVIPPFDTARHFHLLDPLLEPFRQQPGLPRGERLARAIERCDRPSFFTADRLVDAIAQTRLHSRFVGSAVSRRARLFIGRIQPGGAERQLSYLAQGLARAGWDSAVRTFAPPLPGAESYLGIGEETVNQVLPSARAFLSPEQTPDGLPTDIAPIGQVLGLLPIDAMHHVAIAYRSLMQDRPVLVISYLDLVNVPVAIAALLAGVPHILVSGRNLNPTHFPNHYASAETWLKTCYEALLRFPEVRLSANSSAGAHSYEEWLSLPAGGVVTVPNGLPDGMLPPLAPETRTQIRERLGIPAAAALVVGVFRLADEKRPLLFVEVASLLLAAHPEAHVALIGDGPRRSDVETAIAGLMDGVSDRFHLVGARSDATDYLGAADLVLHTAWAEGHPNVLMEAQLLGCPIVCTASYGTAECLYPCASIRVLETDQAAPLVQEALSILADSEQAAMAARSARFWLFEHFSIRQLVTNSLAAAGVDLQTFQTPV
ncbi:hypothetical protein IP70_13240 [alpha proteobacterium AAP38]|nr:hypothetical protein IP70_13240 [alpha proteobacterium AAP38]